MIIRNLLHRHINKPVAKSRIAGDVVATKTECFARPNMELFIFAAVVGGIYGCLMFFDSFFKVMFFSSF